MEFFILILAVIVVTIFLFSCSITNFVIQLPNCQKDTRKAIDRTLVMMGYFINFKVNARILSNRIVLLTAHIQELGESQSQRSSTMLARIRRKALEVNGEAEGIINRGWYRRWTSSCYQLSNRVAVEISKINCILEPLRFEKRIPSTGHEVPGIVVVFLVIYALTNAVLHLPNSATATRDAIDWIVDMGGPFKLKETLKMLTERIHLVKRKIDSLNAHGPRELHDAWEAYAVKEAEKLVIEAEDMINYWYKGWTGSRYMLNRRLQRTIIDLKNLHRLIGGGGSTRNIISKLDDISYVLPATVTDIRHYLHLNNNIQLLNWAIENSAPDRLSAAEAQEFADLLTLQVAARNKAMQLIQEAADIDRHWYKYWPATRYKLSKRLVEMIVHMEWIEDALLAAGYEGQ